MGRDNSRKGIGAGWSRGERVLLLAGLLLVAAGGHLILGAVQRAGPRAAAVLARAGEPGHSEPGDHSDVRLITKPIERIQVGERVLGHNPELTEAQRRVLESEPGPNPASWRRLKLHMLKPDGGRIDIELLRPLQWLKAAGVTVDADLADRTAREAVPVDATMQLNLSELGASGRATLLSIGPCPQIQAGPGCVVTGTFRHSSAEVTDLYVEGQPEPIGTTPEHPFWSEDRYRFVPARSLRPREQIVLAAGKTARVLGQTSRIGTHTVFNLEVNSAHTYCVGAFGAVVHNQCLRGWGNIGSHGVVDADTVLTAAERWLGPGYREIAPGIFRSADGLRQFRMTTRDLLPAHGHIGPHVHFEALQGGRVIENLHIPISP